MSTIVVAGAGPLLGLSIGKVFGAHGFRVALIARRAAELDKLVRELSEAKIEAAGFPADLTEPGQTALAFEQIERKFGPVDVLEYSPTDWARTQSSLVSPSATTVDMALADFRLLVMGAMNCVHQVLPGMLERKAGALLFGMGYSAVKPLSFITSLGISNAGVRNYAYCLSDELAPKGIYICIVPINVAIARGTEGDPDLIAELFWDMYTKRDRIEQVFGSTL